LWRIFWQRPSRIMNFHPSQNGFPLRRNRDCSSSLAWYNASSSYTWRHVVAQLAHSMNWFVEEYDPNCSAVSCNVDRPRSRRRVGPGLGCGGPGFATLPTPRRPLAKGLPLFTVDQTDGV
jgi:hypothetical protein